MQIRTLSPDLSICDQPRPEDMARIASLGLRHHRVVVVGGGSAGIATTASLLKRRKGLDIAVVEPREEHYYQPGWTMVGGGVFKPRDTVRPTGKIMPKGAQWIHAGCIGFDPDRKAILLDDGTRLTYEVLIVAMGNRLAWEAVDGLEAALGQFGVTSNYRYDLAPYTWELVRATRGGRALFTQPPMPIKCAGAPQKAMYLSCSEWRRSGALGGIEVEFHNAGTALFGVADYVPALMEAVQGYGIDLRFGSNLVAVDGPAREATFRTAEGEVTRRFDMLHAVPPRKRPMRLLPPVRSQMPAGMRKLIPRHCATRAIRRSLHWAMVATPPMRRLPQPRASRPPSWRSTHWRFSTARRRLPATTVMARAR